ncbi:MAG: GNAT family N-acetyltransferase [Anaerolineaceae bacterium]
MLVIRKVKDCDLEDLCRIRFADRPEVHLKRIRQSLAGEIDYLVAEVDGHLAGYALLLLKAPSDWLDETSRFPRLIDLYVDKALRNQGTGRAIVKEAEEITLQHGFNELNLSVAPLTNPRAHQLYQKLGYVPVQNQTYIKKQTTQSDGQTDAVEVTLIDLVKVLA